MKNRQQLAQHFADLGFKIGAEVGVCNGYYSKTLLDTIPDLKLHGIDKWSEDVRSHKARHEKDEAYNKTLDILAEFIAKGSFHVIRKSSMEALCDIADESLDFVFIDADHTYDAVKEDINGWTPKVRKGGVVSGHDYYEFKSGKGGVIPAVNEYVAQHNYTLNTTEWDKDNPDRDSRQPCWWFIK